MTKKKSPPVKLTQSEKVRWFSSQISERIRVKPFSSEEEIKAFVAELRAAFKAIYSRDVPGSFISRLLKSCGIDRHYSDKTISKREYIFKLMDSNVNFRTNKTQLIKAVERHFGEAMLRIVFDEAWDEYHSKTEHGLCSIDVDIHGQKGLFT